MKRLLILLLSISAILLVTLCPSIQYAPYYNAKGGKGTEVYCWKLRDDSWRCGALKGTNRLKSSEEIKRLQRLPCTLQVMKNILATYSESERKNVSVLVIDYPTSQLERFYTFYSRDQIPETYSYLYQELNLTSDL